jgi:hypothetical protein
LLPALELLHEYRGLAWGDIAPALDALRRRRPEAATAALAAAFDRLSAAAESDMAGLGEALLHSLFGAEDGAADTRRLAAAALAARRRLGAPAAPVANRAADPALLATGERLARRLAVPRRQPSPPLRQVAWPSGDFILTDLLSQWPVFETVLPAGSLYPGYASLTRDGTLWAEHHLDDAFCHGPYLQLPAGRYRLQVVGETGPEIAFEVVASRYLGSGPNTLCEQAWSSAAPLSGVIAELAFDSWEPMRGFEIIVYVTRPAVNFAISEIRVEARQFWHESGR